MNFGMVLGVVSGFLEERGCRHAVIGAVALAALGLLRTTQDLDLIVESSAQPDLLRFLEACGYETLHRSSGYSNHSHPDPAWGRVDFVYVSSSLFPELTASRCKGTLRGTAWRAASMKSQEPSDLLDFERDIPTTPEDVRALEEHRPRAGEDWLRQLEELSKQFPVSPEDLARRPTFEGAEPFEL